MQNVRPVIRVKSLVEERRSVGPVERGPGIASGPGRRRRTWAVNEYHRMAEAGVLREYDRVELLEGEIVKMARCSGRCH